MECEESAAVCSRGSRDWDTPWGARMCGKERTCGRGFSDLWQLQDLVVGVGKEIERKGVSAIEKQDRI